MYVRERRGGGCVERGREEGEKEVERGREWDELCSVLV